MGAVFSALRRLGLMATHPAVHVHQLNADSLPAWLHLTSPLLRTYAIAALRVDGANGNRFIALALESESQEPIGLLLAEVMDWTTDDQSPAQRVCIHSLCIAKPYRRQGLGRLLLSRVEQWAIDHHLSGLHLRVPLQAKSSAAMLKMTSATQGWRSTPGTVIVGLSVSARVEALLRRLEAVVQRQSRDAAWQMEPFPGQHTTALQERITTAEQAEAPAPPDPDPESQQWQPAVEYSRIVLSEGQIIGWLITHFVSTDCLRYAKFWVDPGWEQSGAPLAMLASVMRSAHFCESTNVIPKGCFMFHPSNQPMHHWIKKQFRPVSDSWSEIENRDLAFEQAHD